MNRPLVLVGAMLVSLLITVEGYGADKMSSGRYTEPFPAFIAPDRLPPAFKGVDYKKFYRVFRRSIDSIEKGEFETTEEFKARTSDADKILAPITTKALYAFRVPAYALYDADKQAYRLRFDNRCYQHRYHDYVTCEIGQLALTKRTYIGSNAYGAEIEVEEERGERMALAFPLASDFVVRRIKDNLAARHGIERDLSLAVEQDLPVAVESARQHKKQTLSVLVVGNVIDAEVIDGHSVDNSPTLDDPRDIHRREYAIPFMVTTVIYYFYETGEILRKEDYRPNM